jgi:hypothetical protein
MPLPPLPGRKWARFPIIFIQVVLVPLRPSRFGAATCPFPSLVQRDRVVRTLINVILAPLHSPTVPVLGHQCRLKSLSKVETPLSGKKRPLMKITMMSSVIGTRVVASPLRACSSGPNLAPARPPHSAVLGGRSSAQGYGTSLSCQSNRSSPFGTMAPRATGILYRRGS